MKCQRTLNIHITTAEDSEAGEHGIIEDWEQQVRLEEERESAREQEDGASDETGRDTQCHHHRCSQMTSQSPAIVQAATAVPRYYSSQLHDTRNMTYCN